MARVVINGGGLVGALAAVVLKNRSDVAEVTVFEKRGDLRLDGAEQGRSINLIITSRGIHALRLHGLVDAALALTVPVKGRMLHSIDGTSKFQPYGVSDSEANYSVSRSALNALLITEAERRGVAFRFNHALKSLDLGSIPRAHYLQSDGSDVVVDADFFVGADGVASGTREAIVAQLRRENVQVSDFSTPLGISYKEICFPSGPAGNYILPGDSLHIWPRGPHFIMALADKGSTFTGTMYLPDGSAELQVPVSNGPPIPTFRQLQEGSPSADEFFQSNYSEVATLVPDVRQQLSSHAAGRLATIHCSHWNYKGAAVLLGDAAHGVVPFFGQGMNCGFESVVVLDRMLTKHGIGSPDSRDRAFAEFTAIRRPNSEAIAAMAEENFVEMSFKVSQAVFLQRKAIENAIEKQFPRKLRSRYYMVVATLIPYETVRQVGPHVEKVIDEVVELREALAKAGATEPAQNPQSFIDGPLAGLSEEEVLRAIDKHLTGFLAARGIDLADPLREY